MLAGLAGGVRAVELEVERVAGQVAALHQRGRGPEADPRVPRFLDALAETARNRGLKLVRSRVRTPGKRGFGMVGLTDQSDKPVFGLDGKEPTATPDEVELYLRNLGAKDWGASLDVAVLPRKRKAKKSGRPPPAPAAGRRATPPRG